jgi:predicted esterase
MIEKTFKEADWAVDELLHQERYEEALTKLEEMLVDFPDWAYLIHQSIAATYRRFDPEKAMAQYFQALEHGYFFPVDRPFIKDHIDHLPEYPELLEKTSALREQAQKGCTWKWEVFPPKSSAEKPYPVIVFLHGQGGSLDLIKSYWSPDAFVELGYLVVYIQPDEVTRYNGYAWPEDYSLARKQIIQVIDTVKDDYEIDPAQISLAGFSRGSMIALDMTLRQSIPVSNCITISCPERPFLDEFSASDLEQIDTRITLLYGERVFSDEGKPLMKKLDQLGVPYNVEFFPKGGHWYPPDIVERTIAILAVSSSSE